MEFRSSQPGFNPENYSGNEDVLKGNADELIFMFSLKRRKVRDSLGLISGRISDFLMSRKSGKIEYVLIRQKSFFSGKKYFTVPYHLIEYRGPYEPVLINANLDMIANSPRFDKRELRDIFTSHYDLIVTYWGGYLRTPDKPMIYS